MTGKTHHSASQGHRHIADLWQNWQMGVASGLSHGRSLLWPPERSRAPEHPSPPCAPLASPGDTPLKGHSDLTPLAFLCPNRQPRIMLSVPAFLLPSLRRSLLVGACLRGGLGNVCRADDQLQRAPRPSVPSSCSYPWPPRSPQCPHHLPSHSQHIPGPCEETGQPMRR